MNTRLRCKIFAIIPVVTLCATLCAAQAIPAETVFRTETRLVVLHATVTDPAGKLILDLKKEKFSVFENGVEQTIASFRHEDVPVSLGLVIDNSASMRPMREQVATAAVALVQASNPDDEVFVINFEETPSLDADFTNDLGKLKTALARLNTRRGTAMYDAVAAGIEHVKGREKKDKKVILVVTDGNDNSSLTRLDRLIAMAQKGDVIIYAVGLLDEDLPRESEKARRALDALTKATGGQAYYPKAVEEVQRIAPQIAHEIRNQYILTYSPSNQEADGTYRKIELRVDVPGAEVRTRAGYYAASPDKVSSIR